MGTVPVQLNRFIHGVSKFQDLSVVNATAMDIASVDVPLLALSKNPEELKERLFRQSVALGFTFLLAPVMAIGIAKLCGRLALSPQRLGGLNLRQLGIHPSELLSLSHEYLHSVSGMQAALAEKFGTRIGAENLKILNQGLDQNFRERLIKAKTSFLAWGMASQGVFWASLGWIKNAFSKQFITGNDQFTGERGVVPQAKLDQLYEQEKPYSGISKNWRGALCAATGILVPFAVAGLLRKSMLQPVGAVTKFIAAQARHIDFKQWRGLPYLSLPAFAVLSVINDIAESVTARSKRESVENLIVKGTTDSIFFCGTGAWMVLFSRLIFGKNRPPLQAILNVSETKKWAEALLKAGTVQIAKPAEFVQSMTQRSAAAYLGCFALNTAVLAGVLALVNRYTKGKVLKASQSLGGNLFTNIPVTNTPEKSRLQTLHEQSCHHGGGDHCTLSRFSLSNNWPK